jgi:hypothetical protein
MIHWLNLNHVPELKPGKHVGRTNCTIGVTTCYNWLFASISHDFASLLGKIINIEPYSWDGLKPQTRVSSAGHPEFNRSKPQSVGDIQVSIVPGRIYPKLRRAVSCLKNWGCKV